MANPSCRQGTPLFVGPPEQLQTLASWLDDLTRAVYCSVTDGKPSEELNAELNEVFIVDLRALNKVLAVGNDMLGCLNIVDAQRHSRRIGELQRHVAACLAGGLDGALEPTAQQHHARTRLQCKLREAMRHFHRLGVRVRDKLKPQAVKEPKPGKWDHVWEIIQKENAVKACGKDQKIANTHNRVCAKKIEDGTCGRIDAKKWLRFVTNTLTGTGTVSRITKSGLSRGSEISTLLSFRTQSLPV